MSAMKSLATVALALGLALSVQAFAATEHPHGSHGAAALN